MAAVPLRFFQWVDLQSKSFKPSNAFPPIVKPVRDIKLWTSLDSTSICFK